MKPHSPAEIKKPAGGPVNGGTPGNTAGNTELDAADAPLGPTTFVAVTLNVYEIEVPVVRPETVAFRLGARTVTLAPPGDAVTVYERTGLRPSCAGAFHATVA